MNQKEFMKYLKNKKAYDKQTLHEVDVTTSNYIKGDHEEVEAGFVDGLFALYKLRELILKSKEEILSKWVDIFIQS